MLSKLALRGFGSNVLQMVDALVVLVSVLVIGHLKGRLDCQIWEGLGVCFSGLVPGVALFGKSSLVPTFRLYLICKNGGFNGASIVRLLRCHTPKYIFHSQYMVMDGNPLFPYANGVKIYLSKIIFSLILFPFWVSWQLLSACQLMMQIPVNENLPTDGLFLFFL